MPLSYLRAVTWQRFFSFFHFFFQTERLFPMTRRNEMRKNKGCSCARCHTCTLEPRYVIVSRVDSSTLSREEGGGGRHDGDRASTEKGENIHRTTSRICWVVIYFLFTVYVVQSNPYNQLQWIERNSTWTSVRCTNHFEGVGCGGVRVFVCGELSVIGLKLFVVSLR